MRAQGLERIKAWVADQPWAPEGIELYTWVEAPAHWRQVPVPPEDAATAALLGFDKPIMGGAVITFTRGIAVDGIMYRIGWSDEVRVAAIQRMR